MGMFDWFVYECCNCGKEIESQTKITKVSGRGFRRFKTGDDVPVKDDIWSEFGNKINLLDINKCEGCECRNVIRIVNGKFVKVLPQKCANLAPWLFGSFMTYEDWLKEEGMME